VAGTPRRPDGLTPPGACTDDGGLRPWGSRRFCCRRGAPPVLAPERPSPGRGGSWPVVVEEVVTQQAAQMGFVQHHNVVEAPAAEDADETVHLRILPRRPRRCLDFVDPHGLRSPRERDPVHRIAIAQEVSRGSLPGAGRHELLSRPLGGGVSVTLMWTTRRRSCARTTKTNKTLHSTVGTTKKSTETRFPGGCRERSARSAMAAADGGPRTWRPPPARSRRLVSEAPREFAARPTGGRPGTSVG
jgi:hypothetical protein